MEKYGWTLARIKGSHHIYTKENTYTIVIIPVHGNRDLPIGTLKGILRDTGLTENDIKKRSPSVRSKPLRANCG